MRNKFRLALPVNVGVQEDMLAILSNNFNGLGKAKLEKYDRKEMSCFSPHRSGTLDSHIVWKNTNDTHFTMHFHFELVLFVCAKFSFTE